MKRIAPSILSADFTRLGEEIRAVEAAGADWIHVDVMDGHFVPNITIGPLVVQAVRKVTGLPLDVHLMIENPDRYIGDFAKAGADLISVQAEACVHLHRTLHHIRECGARPGVVLNPSTGLSALEWVLGDVDLVTLMSVMQSDHRAALYSEEREVLDHTESNLRLVVKLVGVVATLLLTFKVLKDKGKAQQQIVFTALGIAFFISLLSLFSVSVKKRGESIRRVRKLKAAALNLGIGLIAVAALISF